jgi:hypothetical protein
MSALLKEQRVAPTDPDNVEMAEEALRELTRLFVEVDARRGRIERRMNEVRMGAVELRRRRARTALDAYLPPLTFISIEDGHEATPPNRGRGAVTSGRRDELKAHAREVAARIRFREQQATLRPVPVTDADPDAREAVTSSARMVWPRYVLHTFQRAHVIRNPVRLYDDIPPNVVRPASPVKGNLR